MKKIKEFIVKIKFTSILRLVLLFLFIFTFFYPSSKANIFDGIPFGRIEILMIPILAWLLFWNPFWNSAKKIYIVFSVFVAMIILQLIGNSALPTGWSVCLRGEVAREPITTACERTAQFPNGEKSYILSKINFPRLSVPLFFMNQNNYGFSQIEHNRYNLPYSFSSEGYIKSGDSDSITIKSTIPNTVLKINDNSFTLPVGQEITKNLPENKVNIISIRYSVSAEYENELYVSATSPIYYKSNFAQNNSLNSLYTYSRFILIFALLILLASWKMPVFMGYTKRLKIIIPALLGISAVLFLVKVEPDPALLISVIGIITIGWIYNILNPEEKKSFLSWALILLYIQVFILTSKLQVYGQMKIWPGGADTFTYADYARQALTATNLKEFLTAGEYRLFYFQPLYRYFVAITHYFTGESYWGVYFLQTNIAALFIFAGISYLARYINKVSAIAFSALILVFNGIMVKTSLFILTQDLYTQSFGVPLFLLSIVFFMWTISSKENIKPKYLFLSGLLFGISFMSRTDFIPAAPVILVAFYLFIKNFHVIKKTIIKSFAFFLSAMAIGPLFVIFRNYIVTGKPVLMPTSTMINILPDFRGVIPYFSGPVEGSGVKILLHIIYHYRSNPGELIDALLWNIEHNIIQPISTMPREFLWYSTLTLVLLAVFVAIKNKAMILWLSLALLLILGVSSFFLIHSSYGMIAIFDYFLMIIFSIALSSIISLRKNNATK